MTSHCITWHDTTQAITSHQMTWPSLDLTPQQTSRHQNTSLQSTKHHHHGTAEGSFTAKKWFGHRAGRSPCAHSIGKFFLCYIVLFLLETSAPGLSGHYWYYMSEYMSEILSECICHNMSIRVSCYFSKKNARLNGRRHVRKNVGICVRKFGRMYARIKGNVRTTVRRNVLKTVRNFHTNYGRTYFSRTKVFKFWGGAFCDTDSKGIWGLTSPRHWPPHFHPELNYNTIYL